MTTPLRDDFDAPSLRLLARNTKDAGQARRLLALAAIYEGGKRHEAAKIGGVTLQIVRDWVVKFNARGAAGLIDGKAPGQSSLLDAAQRAALAAVVESGPTLGVHGVVRWRLIDLCHWVWQTFRISISPQTMSRELRAMTTASCRCGRVIMVRPKGRSRFLKAFPRLAGASRARARHRRGPPRDLVL